MIEFINPNKYTVSLPGPDRTITSVRKGERVVLPEFFKRYVPRYLKVLREDIKSTPVQQLAPLVGKQHPQIVQPVAIQHKKYVLQTAKPVTMINTVKRTVVGKMGLTSLEATRYYQQIISNTVYPISNDIGVGILSYNRLHSIRRLVESIQQHTNLNMTTVFISDESSDKLVKDYLRGLDNIVVLDNTERLGIAGNTNRLLRCLSRFRYKIVLNDDVEVKRPGWEQFYVDALARSGYHHFCMRQTGLYNASRNEGIISKSNDATIHTIREKPHGAILVFDNAAFDKVGYFDESFGLYGMEHVDWSSRISKSGLQPSGYHDAVGSEDFYVIHPEKSAVENRGEYLSKTRELLNAKQRDIARLYVNCSDKIKVDSVSYIIPYRGGAGRDESVRIVLQNVKAQKFPFIEIILSEQDIDTKIKYPHFKTAKYVLAKSPAPGTPFIKSLAFNMGFVNVTTDKVILHDADMLVQNDYTSKMAKCLDTYNGVHIGKNVLYLNGDATERCCHTMILDKDLAIEKTVTYFEGGSLGCKYNTYVSIGGFNEDFVGYGNEDTEFFNRLFSLQNTFNTRSLDFIHLHHNRTDGWQTWHNKNKALEASLFRRPMVDRMAELSNRLISKYRVSVH